MEEMRSCKHHGDVVHIWRQKRWRCRKCGSEYVTATRKKHRLLLIEEAGGKCYVCGYDRYFGALDFHHRNPSEKSFGLSGKGQTVSLDRKRKEIEKCDLLCANCHREVEGNFMSV